MVSEVGLRERKKQQTRQLIADTARDLFIQRGFDNVTVAEVARTADVAQKTVFNYFPTKEDLFYSGMESFEGRLLDAIRERKPGESFLTAFGRVVANPGGLLGDDDPDASERLAQVTRVVTESPALLVREQEILSRATASLAALYAAEIGSGAGDIEPWVAANAMMGVHRALLDYVRRGIVAGTPKSRLARDVRAQARKALTLLRQGLDEGGVEREP